MCLAIRKKEKSARLLMTLVDWRRDTTEEQPRTCAPEQASTPAQPVKYHCIKIMCRRRNASYVCNYGSMNPG